MKKSSIIIVLALAFLCTACGTTSHPTTVAPGAIASPTPLPVPISGIVGKPVAIGPWTITLESITLLEQSRIPQVHQYFPTLPSSERFVELALQIENTSPASQQFAGMWFHLQDSDGNLDYVQYPSLPERKSATGLGGIVPPGYKLQGLYRYSVPVSLQAMSWMYTDPETHALVIWPLALR